MGSRGYAPFAGLAVPGTFPFETAGAVGPGDGFIQGGVVAALSWRLYLLIKESRFDDLANLS